MPILSKAVTDALAGLPTIGREITNRLDRIIELLEELQQQG